MGITIRQSNTPRTGDCPTGSEGVSIPLPPPKLGGGGGTIQVRISIPERAQRYVLRCLLLRSSQSLCVESKLMMLMIY